MQLTATSLVAAVPAAEGGNDMPLIPHIPELIFTLVVFAILWFVVAKKVVPNLERAYAERTAALQSGVQPKSAGYMSVVNRCSNPWSWSGPQKCILPDSTVR